MLRDFVRDKALAIVGWHEGMAGQLHSLLAAEGIAVDCFLNEYCDAPHIVNRPKRLVQKFDYPEKDSYKNIPLITSNNWVDILKKRDVYSLLITCSEPAYRQKIYEEGKKHFFIATYIHESAIIFPEAIIHNGSILLANTFVGYRSEIHPCTFLNTGVQVDHNSVVCNFSSIMPRATLAGNVEIGERVTIGAGATVLNRVHIGNDAYIGAGSLVRHDVLANTMVIGVPAQFHRNI